MPFPEGAPVAGLFIPAGTGHAQRVCLLKCQTDPDGIYSVPVFTGPPESDKRLIGYEFVPVIIEVRGKPRPTKLSIDDMWDGWEALTMKSPEEFPWLSRWLLQ